MKKISITGGAGFIGSHLVDFYCDNYPNAEMIVIDKMTYAADRENLSIHLNKSNFKLIESDVCDSHNYLSHISDCDLLIHTAAESHVDNSFHNSAQFTLSNTYGTHILLEAAQKAGVKKIIHLSTDEIYGENTCDRPHDEESHYNPTNPYAASKASAEMLTKSYVESFGMPITVIRANNIFGVRQFPEKIIPRTISRLLNELPALIYGDGSNLRSYLSAYDLCEAFKLLHDQMFNGQVFNVGSKSEYSNIQMISKLCELMGKDPKESIKFVTDRPFNDSRYLINYEKIMKLGWSQNVFIEDQWETVIEWYAQNIDRYKNVEL
jgi:UDP-glucose 4,6-dehydratase